MNNLSKEVLFVERPFSFFSDEDSAINLDNLDIDNIDIVSKGILGIWAAIYAGTKYLYGNYDKKGIIKIKNTDQVLIVNKTLEADLTKVKEFLKTTIKQDALTAKQEMLAFINGLDQKIKISQLWGKIYPSGKSKSAHDIYISELNAFYKQLVNEIYEDGVDDFINELEKFMVTKDNTIQNRRNNFLLNH